MLPYAALQAAQQGDPNRRNSNLTGGPPWWGRSGGRLQPRETALIPWLRDIGGVRRRTR